MVDLGSGCGHIVKHLSKDSMKKLIMCDMSGKSNNYSSNNTRVHMLDLEQALKRDMDQYYPGEIKVLQGITHH